MNSNENIGILTHKQFINLVYDISAQCYAKAVFEIDSAFNFNPAISKLRAKNVTNRNIYATSLSYLVNTTPNLNNSNFETIYYDIFVNNVIKQNIGNYKNFIDKDHVNYYLIKNAVLRNCIELYLSTQTQLTFN